MPGSRVKSMSHFDNCDSLSMMRHSSPIHSHQVRPIAMYPPASPALPDEIVNDILAIAVRRDLASHPLRDHASLTTRIAPCVNTLARNAIPTVSRTVAVRLPWTSLDIAARFGHIWMLNVLVDWRHVYPLQFTRDWLSEAAKAAHLHVFEWWYSKSKQNSGKPTSLPIQCDLHGIMDAASGHGHVQVLTWWKANVLDSLRGTEAMEAYYSAKSVDDASHGGHVECLDWWLSESGLPIKYTSAAIRAALTQKHHAVLDWWDASGLDFTATLAQSEIAPMTPIALKNMDLVGFQWLVVNSLALFQDMTCLCALQDDPDMSFFHACAALVPGGALTTAHLPFPHVFESATKAGRIDIVNHLLALHQRIPDHDTVLMYLKIASQHGHVHALDWWFAHISPDTLTFDQDTSKVIRVAAAAAGHLNVLEWWSPRVLAAIPTFAENAQVVDTCAIEQAASKGHLHVLQWFALWAASYQQDAAVESMRKANGYSLALQAGHGHVIRWAAAHNWFAHIPRPNMKACIRSAALSGHCDAIEAYIEGVCCVRVGNSQTKDQHALDLGLKGDGSRWWKLVPGLEWDDSSLPHWLNWVCAPAWIVDSLTRASECCDLRTLNWWISQGGMSSMPPSDIQDAMRQASKNGHLDVLDWWCLIGTKGRFSRTCRRFEERFRYMYAGRKPVDPFVLEWWLSSPFRFSGRVAHVYRAMIYCGQVRLLEKTMSNWNKLATEQYEQGYEGATIYRAAAECGQVDVLDW
ncbi:hypothetical protein BCR44DRAFT_1222576 [Catenaria anguillulae PL171]|uniref:Ankyrin repeat-containing domain protein n=1 Tax=Catenaria anguillulae PL171 TaxID=765915 RepID=A0A1Y2HEB1_9FUNG|nr:hypothetical protein BCR44DRAFT_1222576 [Catenaria anguillulae PL171]